MRKIVQNTLLFCCLCLGGIRFVAAAGPQNLYDIELSMPVENAHPQTQLMQQAFKEILVRVSGTQTVLEAPAIVRLFSTPDQYIKQFSYHQRLSGERFMKVSFNDTLINRLLSSANQPIWSANRPLVLLWLVIEKAQHVSWATNDTTPLVSALEASFRQRAMPVMFPLLDLMDLSDISEQTVFNQQIEALQKSSERYKPDAVLVGTVKYENSTWNGEWTLIRAEEASAFKTARADLKEFSNAVAEQLVPFLRTSEGVAVGARVTDDRHAVGSLMLTVSDIIEPEQYRKVLEYLQRLSMVKAVEVIQLSPEQTVFKLTTRASRETIVDAIAAGEVLIKKQDPQDQNALLYQLLNPRSSSSS